MGRIESAHPTGRPGGVHPESYTFYSRLLSAIKRQIREVHGPEPKDLKAYYRRYAREFEKARPVRATEEQAFEAMVRAPAVLVGDFHTLDQSQKQFRRLVEGMMARGHRPAIALEMVPARHEEQLRAYLGGSLEEGDFLLSIRYFDRWGFDFTHYRPILDLAREHGLALHGINGGRTLLERDRFMADRILRLHRKYPKVPLMVLVGDLHLARPSLPRELSDRGMEAMVVLQNSETIQMRTRREGGDPSGWWLLSPGRYLVNNTTPWVKMQTYLTWLEHGGEAICSMYAFCRWGKSNRDLDSVDLTETVYQYIRVLKDLFGLHLHSDDDFQVFTLNDLEFLKNRYFKMEPGKTYASLIREGRALYLLWGNTIYIPMLDVNRTVQEAAHYLMGRNLCIDEGRTAFHDRIHYFGCGYLASKLVNPLRRTEDRGAMRRAIREYGMAGPRDRAYLTRHRRTSLYALDFLNRLGLGEEFLPNYIDELTQRDREFSFSVSEMLGRYLGEDLYTKYDGGRFSGAELKHYVFGQRNPFLNYDHPLK